MERQHKKIDKLVNKYCGTPKHPESSKWLETILASGLYDESDIKYLVTFRRKQFESKGFGVTPKN